MSSPLEQRERGEATTKQKQNKNKYKMITILIILVSTIAVLLDDEENVEQHPLPAPHTTHKKQREERADRRDEKRMWNQEHLSGFCVCGKKTVA